MPSSLITIGLIAGGGLLGILVIAVAVRKVRAAWRNSLLGVISQGVKDEIRQGKVGPEDLKFDRSMLQSR